MVVKIDKIEMSTLDPKKMDYENMPDEKFFDYKIPQSLSVLAKAFELTRFIKNEQEKIEEIQKKVEPVKVTSTGNSATIEGPTIINRTGLSSLEFSMLLLQFSSIEALLGVLSDCILRKNQTSELLHSAEVDFLKEQKTIYSKGKVVSDSSFVRLEEKIKGYPELLAKIGNIDFEFDSSKHYWANFKNCKKVRDDITHPKNGVTGQIDISLLFQMSEFIYWYFEQVFELFERVLGYKYYRMIEQCSFALLSNMNRLNGGDKSHIAEQTKKHEELKVTK